MEQNLIHGPNKSYSIKFDYYGKYLFDCLKKRNPTEIIAINSLTKESLTCGQLLDQSTKLAIALKTLSIRKGDVVALVSENNFSCYIISCATFFCGAILQPLNYAYTQGELKHLIGLSKPKIVFSSKISIQNVLLAEKQIDCIQTIILTESDDVIKNRTVKDLIDNVKNCDAFEIVPVDIADTITLCSSSGTTGLPKCVELTHQNIVPLMNTCFYIDGFDVSSKDTTVLVIPFFHFYGLIIHLLAVTHSITVVQMKSFKPELFLQSIEEYEATKLFLVPPLLLFLVKSPIVSKYNLTSVQDMMIGAAPFSDELYREALHKFSHSKLREFYGATEVSGPCTIQHHSDTYKNVGKVICNTTIKVVDIDTKAILGSYRNGEICVKSMCVMKGYYNNPHETKNSIDSDGFYHTGDIGYYDKNENFFIVDRIKELIKYKCFQVAPAELENLLSSHPDVRDCGVCGIKDERCGQLPVAFVVRQDGSKVTEDEIVKYVAENISIQKQLHGGVRFIEEVPRNASGKILRRELMKLLPNNSSC